MSDKTLNAIVKRARKCAHRRHSKAYQWLRAKHATLAPVLEECEPPLDEIALEMNKAGIPGGRNRPMTGRSVAEIWKRVCRDVAEAQTQQVTGIKAARHQPSRAPATWQPPVARYPPDTHRGGARQAAAPSPRASPDASAPGAAPEEDSWDRAWREIERRSGR